MNVIFDLDGTLIDSRNRLYSLFQKLVPDSSMTYERYWSYKRDRVSNESVLEQNFGYNEKALAYFKSEWMSKIESSEFLALDSNMPGIFDALKTLSFHATLHVCTARQHPEIVVLQLEQLGLLPYFKSIMVTGQRGGKEKLISEVSSLSNEDWIVGDTGKDIQVGHALGIKTCAVLSGFLSEKSIKRYKPNLIMPAATDFCTYLSNAAIFQP